MLEPIRAISLFSGIGAPELACQSGIWGDAARYKAIGNSMAVPVLRWVLSRLCVVDAIQQKHHPQRSESLTA